MAFLIRRSFKHHKVDLNARSLEQIPPISLNLSDVLSRLLQEIGPLHLEIAFPSVFYTREKALRIVRKREKDFSISWLLCVID